MSGAVAQVGQHVRHWGATVLDLVFPSVCSGCQAADAEADGLCDACRVKLLSLVALPYCLRCGQTRGPHVPVYGDGCHACPTPLPRFTHLIRLAPYAPPLRGAIRQFKYHQSAATAVRLVDLLATRIAETCEAEFDVVIPVPMFWSRRLGRRFDHSRWLAERLAKQLQLPVAMELKRTRNTPPQVGRNRTKRIENVRDAFSCSGAVAGARVLLVDDVTTTGATASECARTLRAANASSVTLAVLAKAEPPQAYRDPWAGDSEA